MDKLNISGLKRNPDIIKKCFKKVGKSLVVTKSIRVIFPDRYNNIDLALIGKTTRVVAIYAILDDEGNYAISNLPIFIELTPSNISDIDIDGNINKVLHFEAGEMYTPSSALVIDNRFLYDLFNEFYINGRIPWFMDYSDAISIFEKTKKYANSDLGENPITMEILSSIIARPKGNLNIFYRQKIKSIKDIVANKPEYIGLMNIFYTFDNTVSKLVGSYYSKGVSSAIVNKETSTTKIEEILRS